MKKLFSVFAIAFMAVLFLNMNSVSVSAAEPTTYVVQYREDKEDWFYQKGSSWDNDKTGRELYYMTLEFKDGDYVVVSPSEGFGTLELNFQIGNLTIMPKAACIVKAKAIKDCYVCTEAYAVINGNVDNAYIYEYATANFNNDVKYLEHYYKGEITIKAAVAGTLDHLYVHTDGYSKYDLYRFVGTFCISDGALEGPIHYYVNKPEESTGTATTTPPASNAGELDDVPKTGDSTSILWAFGLAAVCFLGSYSLKKRA